MLKTSYKINSYATANYNIFAKNIEVSDIPKLLQLVSNFEPFVLEKYMLHYVSHNCPNIYIIKEILNNGKLKDVLELILIKICKYPKTKIVENAFKYVLSFDENSFDENSVEMSSFEVLYNSRLNIYNSIQFKKQFNEKLFQQIKDLKKKPIVYNYNGEYDNYVSKYEQNIYDKLISKYGPVKIQNVGVKNDIYTNILNQCTSTKYKPIDKNKHEENIIYKFTNQELQRLIHNTIHLIKSYKKGKLHEIYTQINEQINTYELSRIKIITDDIFSLFYILLSTISLFYGSDEHTWNCLNCDIHKPDINRLVNLSVIDIAAENLPIPNLEELEHKFIINPVEIKNQKFIKGTYHSIAEINFLKPIDKPKDKYILYRNNITDTLLMRKLLISSYIRLKLNLNPLNRKIVTCYGKHYMIHDLLPDYNNEPITSFDISDIYNIMDNNELLIDLFKNIVFLNLIGCYCFRKSDMLILYRNKFYSLYDSIDCNQWKYIFRNPINGGLANKYKEAYLKIKHKLKSFYNNAYKTISNDNIIPPTIKIILLKKIITLLNPDNWKFK